MKRWRKTGKLRAALLAVAVTFVFTMQTAVTTPAEERKPSLSFDRISSDTGKAAQGVEWSVYRVADMREDETYWLTSSFAGSGLDIKKLEQEKYMRDSAEEIVDYIGKNSIKAEQTVVTGSDGRASMEALEKGIYLVRLSGTPGTDWEVKSEPFFVTLPILLEENNAWAYHYDVTVHPKAEVTIPDKPEESKPEESKPEESKPEESKPGESESEESKPGESESEESKPGESESEESKPEESKPQESGTDESKPQESKPDETEPGESNTDQPSSEETKSDETTGGGTSGGGNSGGGSHNRDHGGGTSQGTGMEEEILDNPTPLASFLQEPQEPELVEIEDLPVPLAGLPHIPKLGDMGIGGYLAGLAASFLLGCGALVRRKKYGRGES